MYLQQFAAQMHNSSLLPIRELHTHKFLPGKHTKRELIPRMRLHLRVGSLENEIMLCFLVVAFCFAIVAK